MKGLAVSKRIGVHGVDCGMFIKSCIYKQEDQECTPLPFLVTFTPWGTSIRLVNVKLATNSTRRAPLRILHHLSRWSDGFFLLKWRRTTGLDGPLEQLLRCSLTPVKACMLGGAETLAAESGLSDSDVVGSEEDEVASLANT